MKHTSKLLLSSMVVFLSACNLEPPKPIKMPTDAEVEQYNASVEPEERIVCRNEKVVSSSIPRRVCRRVIDMEEDALFTRQELIRAIR